MRYEIKFDLRGFQYKEIYSIIKSHPAKFTEYYKPRQINNIYFDDIFLSNYENNIEGQKERKKIRIRWYGNLLGLCKSPCLEVKNKIGPLGWKDKYNLDSFKIKREIPIKFNSKVLEKNKKKNLFASNFLKSLRPTLVNSYKREYFISKDNKFRLTLDEDLKFYDIKTNLLKKDIIECFDQKILEIKFDKKYFNQVESLTNFFPFRVTKSSKYVFGIEKIRCTKI